LSDGEEKKISVGNLIWQNSAESAKMIVFNDPYINDDDTNIGRDFFL